MLYLESHWGQSFFKVRNEQLLTAYIFCSKTQTWCCAYNLFLLFKFDSLHISDYKLPIKIFRLKYVLLAAKIIRTAPDVVMNLSEKYPYQEVYKNCLS